MLPNSTDKFNFSAKLSGNNVKHIELTITFMAVKIVNLWDNFFQAKINSGILNKNKYLWLLFLSAYQKYYQ